MAKTELDKCCFSSVMMNKEIIYVIKKIKNKAFNVVELIPVEKNTKARTCIDTESKNGSN